MHTGIWSPLIKKVDTYNILYVLFFQKDEMSSFWKNNTIGWLTPSNVFPLFDITEYKASNYRISSYSFLPWLVSSPWIVSSLDEFKKEYLPRQLYEEIRYIIYVMMPSFWKNNTYNYIMQYPFKTECWALITSLRK